jgi:hypothetical protein
MRRFELGNGGGRGATEFTLQRVDEGARYDGPHGPMTLTGDVENEHATVRTEQGEATLAWSRLSAEDLTLENDGIPVDFGAAGAGRLRRHGRELRLDSDDGQTRAILRRRFGRIRMERPDGTELATWKDYRGRVCAEAEFADVALMVLVMASRVDQRLDRPALTL